ncbi:MAG: hypothetical protein B1H13_07335 [Desulfobacteraceae bacterium 4484_190.3]|nr:MAG: hypothetical protein B1H13_07335 [Desulfobacteraceae bacterium 4484_190.3]
MQKRFSIAETKNKLPSIIHDVEKGNSVELTRRGKPVAALLSIKEYERLCGKNQDFWSGLMAIRQVIENENIEISDLDFEGLRDPSTGRGSE